MKKLFTLASLVALTFASCAKEETKSVAEGEGRVTISCEVATDVVETRANVSCTTPSKADFDLTIEGVDHTYTAYYDDIAVFEEDSYLHLGTYTATVKAGDVTEEGYDAAAFAGSQEFEVTARQETSVTITATIINALVRVDVTEDFKRYFPGGHSLKLTTEAGNEFDVSAQTEPIFFAPGAFTISGTAVKQSAESGAEGATVALPEYKHDAAEAQHYYTVKFDVESAGNAKLIITLNDTPVEEIEIEQELNDNSK